ncbi:MAG: FAD-dependent oxidoreductase [Sandaracinaceae bacterium]
MTRAIVIGGGPAGLAAAVALASEGVSVTVLEADRELGGRARHWEGDGYRINLGPHALYPQAERSLNGLGVEVTGRTPNQDLTFELDGRTHPIPSGPLSLLSSGAFSLAEKMRLARLFASIGKPPTASLATQTVAEWLDGLGLTGGARRFAEAGVRIATYANAPERLSAAVAVRQLGSAQVRYVDGGWGGIVDALARRAEGLGVTIRTRAKVRSVEPGAVQLEGEALACDAVVLAVGPKRAVSLLGAHAPASLRAFAEEAAPVRASHLDVALRALPRARPSLVLGADRPLYASVHSSYAEVAPEGGAVIHLARYLAPDERVDPAAARRELEAVLEQIQPGWRGHLVHARFAPASLVMHALPEARSGGVAGRPAALVTPGVAVAGDWVGDTGLLLEASLASALAAAHAVMPLSVSEPRAAV